MLDKTTVTIHKQTYNRLKSIKRKDEPLSNTLKRVLDRYDKQPKLIAKYNKLLANNKKLRGILQKIVIKMKESNKMNNNGGNKLLTK